MIVNAGFMEEHDQIIVFRKYESSIEANLAKTKLDAYGVPCFLTEENVTNLYPLQNLLLFGVRLHIFRNDRQLVEQVLTETVYLENETLACPVCRSPNIKLEYSQKLSMNLGRMLMGLLARVIVPVPSKKIYRCQDCHREFKTLPEA